MGKQAQGKLIVSAAKSLKSFQIGNPEIASYLYGTSEAGRLGLFASSIKGERRSNIRRIRFLAGQEGIGLHDLTSDLLPWLEKSGLFQLERSADGEIAEVTSLVLAYQDLLAAVSDFYDSRHPSEEDRACLMVLQLANQLPTPESIVRQAVTGVFSEETANTALQLARAFRIVTSSGDGSDPLLYAPRVWSSLHSGAEKALAPLDRTEREVLLHLVDRVRNNQGYPESLFRREAKENGVGHLVELAIGIALLNRTELHMAGGTERSFLTTPHFYADLEDEFGEDMCDRVKIFLDSIRNGQYFGSTATGRILDPERLLTVLLDRGNIGPATAIGTDYIVAEKAGIIRVQRSSEGSRPLMELRQADTVRKVLEVVSSGTVEPGTARMAPNHMSDGRLFKSIEQGRSEPSSAPQELAGIEHEIMRNLREG